LQIEILPALVLIIIIVIVIVILICFRMITIKNKIKIRTNPKNGERKQFRGGFSQPGSAGVPPARWSSSFSFFPETRQRVNSNITRRRDGGAPRISRRFR
jgi:hypothetical protein